MQTTTALGTAVRLLREQQDLTILVLASRAHLDKRVICNIERGSYSPNLASVERIAAALGLSLWQLLRFAARLGDTIETQDVDQPNLTGDHWKEAA